MHISGSKNFGEEMTNSEFCKASGIGKVELQPRHVEDGGGLEGR